MRPSSRGLVKGDILDESCHIDVKGSQIRVSSTGIRGTDYRRLVENVFNPSGIEPNIIKGTGGLSGQTAYEIEKKCHNSHYKEEFKKLTFEECVKLINAYLEALEVENRTESLGATVFPNGVFNNENLSKILIEDWFEKSKEHSKIHK